MDTEEIKQIDRKNIKMLTMYEMHHPKADVDRNNLAASRESAARKLEVTVWSF
jgi:hypothetical protein